MERKATITITGNCKRINTKRSLTNKTVENLLYTDEIDKFMKNIDDEICEKFTKEITKTNTEKIQDATRKHIISVLNDIKKSFAF